MARENARVNSLVKTQAPCFPVLMVTNVIRNRVILFKHIYCPTRRLLLQREGHRRLPDQITC